MPVENFSMPKKCLSFSLIAIEAKLNNSALYSPFNLSMVKRTFNPKNLFKFFLIFFSLMLSVFMTFQKPVTEIVLQNENLNFIPKEFYIDDVVDGRDDKTNFATILSVASKNNHQQTTYAADLKGGDAMAIMQFIKHNLPANKTLRPIIIEIRKFKLSENVLANGMVEGNLSLSLAYDFKRSADEIVPIGIYNGNSSYTRNAGPAQNVEPTIRRLLENGLAYVNTAINQQANSSIKLARSVKITFMDYEEKPEGDTIYYNAKRPLKWDDFKSKVRSNHYEAEVFPTLGYDEHVEVSKAVVNVHLSIKVAIPKSAAWVNEGARNSYTLNHEQRHFDIVKIVSMHFIQKLKAEEIPVNNYEGVINVDYLDAYREMNALQAQYDNETKHGTDQAEQQRWNEKIDKELGGGEY